MNLKVTIRDTKTIILLQGVDGKKRFDALELPLEDGDWKPMMNPNGYDHLAGRTEYRYLKKTANLGGLPISFEYREVR